jgi:carbonic anhydrase
MSTKHEFLRREFLHLSGLTSIGAFLLGHKLTPVSYAASAPLPSDTSADAALQTLKEGNQRFVAMKPIHPNLTAERRTDVAKGQNPFAIIFECVDSRVPPELVFDRGLGDLFVIRTAGQALDKAALGSIEFGVEEYNIPLVMVLGHEKCGAVEATIEVLEKKAQAHGQIRTLVELLKPAVEKVKGQSGNLLDNAIRANIALGVNKLKTSPILAEHLEKDKIKIVGAYYNLDTGVVDITVS